MSSGAAAHERCPYCGFRGALVVVHGHGQCARCHTNIGPCCGGADAANEAAADDGIDTGPDPALFAGLFAHLGGATATVTGEALLFALVQRLGTDLDDAKLVLEAAERCGIVVPAGPNCHRLRSVDAPRQRP
ncbi:MAG: hypothetical protein JNL08_15810 [Planctomycetes bacterium]|nr:hypothetical protein [Planctomycetota bacterium]